MISFNLWLIRRSDAGDFSLRLLQIQSVGNSTELTQPVSKAGKKHYR